MYTFLYTFCAPFNTYTHTLYLIYSYSARPPWPYSAPRATGPQLPMRARVLERVTFRRRNKRFSRLLYRREVSVYILYIYITCTCLVLCKIHYVVYTIYYAPYVIYRMLYYVYYILYVIICVTFDTVYAVYISIYGVSYECTHIKHTQ